MGNSVANTATVVLAVIAVLALGGGAIRWFFKRGADEREFANSVKDNTAATRELTGEFRTFRETAVNQLHNLDLRVTSLEAIKDVVAASSSRDASPPS